MEYCATLEKAIALKDADFPQDTNLTYAEWSMSSTGKKHWSLMDDAPGLCTVHRIISTPNASEILDMLPYDTEINNSPVFLFIQRSAAGYWSMGYRYPADNHAIVFVSEHLETACADLWLWCKANNLIK